MQAKTIVDIDTRRKVFMAASARKPADVVKVPHEAFIRKSLKTHLGWAHDAPAPESIKSAAKAMAAQFIQRDQKQAAMKVKVTA